MRGLVAIIGFSGDWNPPIASTPAAPCRRSPRFPRHAPLVPRGRHSTPWPAWTGRASPASVHVAPVILFQEPGEEREERQEQDHPDAKTLALEGGRLPRVLEESGDVADGLVELRGILRTGLRQQQFCNGALAAGVGLAEFRVLRSLQ